LETALARLERGATAPSGGGGRPPRGRPSQPRAMSPPPSPRPAAPRPARESGTAREEALLRATQMAIRGRPRSEIEAMLGRELGIANPAEIVDQILGPR